MARTHFLVLLHVSKDEPELLGQLLKEEEQEERDPLIPRWVKLRYLVQEVGWLPLPPRGLHLVQLLHVLNNGQLVSRAEMTLKLLVRLVFRRAGYQAQHCAETLLGWSIDHVVEQ